MNKITLDIDKLDALLKDMNMKRLTSCRIVSDKIDVQSKYGIHRVMVFDILKGVRPRIQSALDKRKYFELQSKEIHGNKYSYDNVDFKTLHIKVAITCKEHGDFLQTPDKHLIGRGCPKCGKTSMVNISIDKARKAYFNKVKKIHNNKYDYSLSKYITSKSKIDIICPTHGKFSIIAGNHLIGCGCLKCTKSGRGWKKKDWLDFTKNKNCKLYIIKCVGNNEEFIKIGITSLELTKRFKSQKQMPYNYDIIECIEANGEKVYDIETYLHNKFKFFQYNPEIKFHGSKKECFNKEILELI